MRPPVCQYDFGARDLRAHGCTLASLAYAAREVTDGKAWSGDPEPYVFALQKLSGVPIATFRDRGTTLTEAKVAYEQAPGFEGRVGPRFRLMRGGSVRDDLLPLLRTGSIAVVAVNYGVLVDAKKGVGSFRGGHALVVGEPKGDSLTVADPLRRELVTIKVDLLVRAMETFGKRPWGNGRGEFGIPLPSPTLLERAITQRDAARAALDKERDRSAGLVVQLGAANERIKQLEGQPVDAQTAALLAALGDRNLHSRDDFEGFLGAVVNKVTDAVREAVA